MSLPRLSAYNVLADPDLRALYDALRKDPTVPVPFPYSGFGSLLVQGERPQDGNVFFANRILAFLPKRSRRTAQVPLRKLDYFDDYAILRDHKRKIEVLIDHQLLPLRWDPTWSQNGAISSLEPCISRPTSSTLAVTASGMASGS